MALNFPKTSRVFDETRRCIRFWGHEPAMEISFQIDEDAHMRISPSQQDETSLLHVIDLIVESPIDGGLRLSVRHIDQALFHTLQSEHKLRRIARRVCSQDEPN